MSSDNKVQVEFAATTDGVEKGAQTAAQAVEQSMTRMQAALNGVKSSVDSMHDHFSTAFGGIQTVMAKFNNTMFAVQNVLAGGHLFKEVINETLAFTSETVKLSKALGMTTQEASELNVALKLTGQTAEDFNGMAFKLLRQVNANAAGVESLGLKVKDANGNFRPLMDTMRDAGTMLGEFKEGADRDAAAMYLFGRGAQEAMGVMKLNGEVMARAKVIADEYGLKVGPEGAANARQFKMATAEVNLIFEAMNEKVGATLLPLLTRLAGYFAEVGPPAIAALGGALKVVITVIEAVGVAIGVVLVKVGQWVDDFASAVRAVTGMWLAFQHLSMSEFTAAWKRGNMELVAHSQASADAIATAYTGATARISKLWGDETHGAGQEAPTKKGTRRFTKPEDGGAEKSQMGALKDALREQLEAQGAYFKDSEALELAYWTNIKATRALSVKDAQAVNSEIFNLTKKLLTDQRALVSEQLDQDRNLARERAGVKRAEIEAQRDAGTINAAQALSQIKALNEAEYQIERDTLDAKLGIWQEESRERAKLLGERAALDTKNAAREIRETSAITVEVRKSWENAFAPIGSAFGSAVNGLISRTQTLRGALASIFTHIASDFVTNTVSRMVSSWAAAQAAKLAMSNSTFASLMALLGVESATTAVTKKAEAAAVIPAEAAMAAGGAAASVAGIPIVGPALAAGAYAETMALVMSGLGVASARSGYDIPAGVNPLTQLHEREMVLPQKQADAVRNMADKGAGGSDVHLHVHAVDADSVKRLFRQNGHHLVSVLKQQHRNFAL